MLTQNPVLLRQVEEHPHPLLFTTISGAHLYGFPSADSDFDLRGCHILSPENVLGLEAAEETVQSDKVVDGLEIDLVSHDAKKFFLMMLKKNGYVLEQLYSPLVVQTTPEHEELKSLATGCITRHLFHHYRGFAVNQWKLFDGETPPRVKPLLYTFRVLLTGIHLLRSGEIEADLNRLNENFRLSYVPELVERKTTGAEKERMAESEKARYLAEYQRLFRELEEAFDRSPLPETPTAQPALSDLLIRLRLARR